MNLASYKDLFVHRDDVYAIQQENGMYFPAGEGHWGENEYKERKFIYDSYFPLTDDVLQEHLAGMASYGVYTLKGTVNEQAYCDGAEEFTEFTTKYMVFDLDTYSPEAYEHLVFCLNQLILELGTQPDGSPLATNDCLLMENSGGKGFHAWLFFSTPLPAAQVRSWVAAAFRPSWDAVADAFDGTPLEIFPKQDAPTGGFGNLVKLPFGVHAKSGRRSTVVEVGQGWANDVDSVRKLNGSLVPLRSILPEGSGSATRGEVGAFHAPFACIAHIVEEGLQQGNRDNAMVHLAHYCWGTGVMDYEAVLDACLRANEGFDPPLSASVVAQKVRQSQSFESNHPSCRADWLRDVCPGGEHCYAPWNLTRSESVDESVAYLTATPEQRRLMRQEGQ